MSQSARRFERILTQLRIEGTDVGQLPTQMSCCKHVDSSTAPWKGIGEAIGEAMSQNGRVIVTGCLGASEPDPDQFPDVLSITGPAHGGRGSIYRGVPQLASNPFVDLVPPAGVKLCRATTRIEISEGCNPSVRSACSVAAGSSARRSRVLTGARPRTIGVKELLVISQDSTRTVWISSIEGFWGGRPLRTDMIALCRNWAA
jgi:ribosomal protein S12 methylthiotransferase